MYNLRFSLCLYSSITRVATDSVIGEASLGIELILSLFAEPSDRQVVENEN